ncbi:hypothetical protein GCM10009601_23880 [Streptomyces thermospinosisporus]|uniref:SWIM-type domain-containing protein n=1 Tax=Streptomyces thermospinosisporus TaxID=161482 RepID=A0ABP4JHT5_9ACTN
MTERRPSDKVREALRAARELEIAEEVSQRKEQQEAARKQGPAAAARAALREALRANSERSERGDTDTGTEAPISGGPGRDVGGPGADGNAVAAPDAAADGGGAAPDAPAVAPEAPAAAGKPGRPPAHRPGDIAREALRSARAEALRARRAAEGHATDDTPRGTSTPSALPRTPRTPRTSHSSRTPKADRTAENRARELRKLLADAFRMPASADEPDTAEERDTGARDAAPAAETARPSTDNPRARPRPRPTGDAKPAETAARDESAPTPAFTAPRSMAAPARDSDVRRTFPAFPARPTGEGTHEGTFAETWWGNAWVTALEEGALDAARLARGRTYADRGNVDAITVTPGLVLAYVRGSRPRPYRVQVRLRTFTDADWERFLDTAADRPGHIAALLDKEMPQSLAECGVPLLPGPRDLDPHCSCPDRGHPCKHAAALCYQTARLLDADPFVLLLLRGRGERAVIDDLSRRSAARAARAAQEKEPEPLPGVRASDVLAHGARPPLPAPLPPPPHPEQPPVYPPAPGGPDPFALDQLASDAAARAHALLTTGRDPVGGLSLWQDAVRLAAARPGSGLTAATRSLYASLSKAAGRSPAELARAVAAWRQGGPEGLRVLEEPWDPPAGRFDRARPQLLAADLPAFRPWRNRLTHPRGHVQLRLGRDHLWYAYESEPGQDDWWPRGTPDSDPVGALTGLDTPGDL